MKLSFVVNNFSVVIYVATLNAFLKRIWSTCRRNSHSQYFFAVGDRQKIFTFFRKSITDNEQHLKLECTFCQTYANGDSIIVLFVK